MNLRQVLFALVAILFFQPGLVGADVLYSVSYSLADTSVGKTANFSKVTVVPVEKTKAQVLAEYGKKLKLLHPKTYSQYQERKSKFFASYEDANTYLSDMVVTSKAAGLTIEMLNAAKDKKTKESPSGVTKETSTKPDSTAYTKWPFTTAEAKKRQLDTAKAFGWPLNFEVKYFNGVSTQGSGLGGSGPVLLKFVLIPAGEFMMGSSADERGRNSDEELHKVKISKPFYISDTTVDSSVDWDYYDKSHKKALDALDKAVKTVIQTNQVSAKSGFAFRLPTEAEWEYVCRSGKATAFHTGSKMYGANFHAKSLSKPKSFPANAWGIYDMNGRRYELVSDLYKKYNMVPEVSVDPESLTGSDHVLRGGMYYDSEADIRCAKRLLSANYNGSSYSHRVATRIVMFKLPE